MQPLEVLQQYQDTLHSDVFLFVFDVVLFYFFFVCSCVFLCLVASQKLGDRSLEDQIG